MLQKNANPKGSHGKGKPAPSGAFTHRIREDGEVFSGEEGRETSSDTTPLASVVGSVRMRSTDSDRSVRATPKKARDASPPPQDDLWVVVKNLSQQVAAQQAELDALRNAFALQQKTSAELLVERQPDFRKAGAAAWLALKRETSVPAHSAPKVELSSGLRLIYASGFPYAKPGDLRKAMQGARILWTRPLSSPLSLDSSSEAADKDKLAAISSFAAKTVTTIQRSPDVKARNFFRSLLASIGGKTLEAATAEATKIRVQTPGFDISTMEIVPKESLPVKKATEQEPAAPAVDPPSDMAAEVTPATQDDGVAPTVTPIADVEMSVSITYLRSILAPILGHQMEHVSKIDRRTTKHGARFRITVPEDRQRNIIQRLERQSKQTHWRIRQNYRHRRPDQPRPTAPPPPLSRQILAVNVANISNKRPAIRHIVRNTRLWAISETCITSSKFRFTVPGFDVIQHPATGPGRRGIALGIPSCFGGHEHGHSGATTNYSRREALLVFGKPSTELFHLTTTILFSFWRLEHRPTAPSAHCPLVGSWLTVMQFSGSQITRLSTVHGRRHSSIDHFVCNAPARALLTSPRVDRQTAVADHFVIRTSIRAEAQGQPPVPRAPTISRHHCLEATDRIATSNYWDVLADGATDDTDTDTDIHQLTSQFLESANAVADNLSLRLSPPATRSNRRLLSGTTKRAILASNTARQAFIAAATHTNPDPVQCNTLRDEWSRLKAAATQLERVDGRKQWVKHADNLDRAVSDGRTDLVFAAARAMSGNSSRSAAVTPLYNSDGIVQYDPTSILRVMQGHYGSLAADTTGHSLDLQYWHDRQPIQVSPNTPTIRNSDILDQDFSWNQIAAALLQMSPRKAPGDDGITTAFYQAALYMPANTQEGVPPTPICSCSVENGDPLNPGDKRGIALINVGLKLVCKVLQMRIERFVETNNLLSYEQAGFRKREECVGQVVSLVDIIQRRQNAGLNTHVLFIDIRKAFDTVPSWCTVMEAAEHGIPSSYSCLSQGIVHILICSSSGRITAIGPIPGTERCQTGMSIVWTAVQSVHQRHSRWCRTHHSPWTTARHNPIRGLMYADDVAVFADSEQSLLAASTAIEQWANQWEMQFGVAKCGIISFTGHLAPRLDNPLDIRLHGQLVSRVESYKYLGVLIDSKLDHSAWLKQKRSALEHTISALHPVLANHQLTVNYRSRIFSAVVMGKAYYGLELVGGNKSHLAPLQTTINKGIRLFTGARLSTAIGPLLVETGIGSLLTRSLVSRVRLLERSVTKRTPINAICSGTDNDVFTLNVQGQLVRSQRWFWSRRTKQLYRNRYWLTPQVRPKTVKQRHSFALMETLRTCGDSASLQKYLMLARMDALWTARKAIQIGILVDTHPFSVDHCILCDQQLLSTSIAHLVVECEQVTGHRIQSGLVPAIQKSRLRLLGRALDPGVENVYTWLRGGVLNGEADLDQRWLDGTVEHESMGTRHDNRALAARLADFLQVAYRQYQSTLWHNTTGIALWKLVKLTSSTASLCLNGPLFYKSSSFMPPYY
ncbi:hypothetical protein BASA61_008358 [Batrachochytrium salamandrivorans]|nr:hypothetical protein BASA61_008358 [Batrachochytrium salamandrivorans]